MPDPSDLGPRLTAVETTAASFQAIINELRQFMHDEYETSEKMATAVAGLKAERNTDWTARGIALAALFGVLAIGVMLYLRPGVISQTQEMSITEDDKPSDAEVEAILIQGELERMSQHDATGM